MTSSADFLREMTEEGAKHAGGGGSVARMKIEFGYNKGYIPDIQFEEGSFWKYFVPVEDMSNFKKSSPLAAAKAKASLQADGHPPKIDFGARIMIYAGEVNTFKGDFGDFIAVWQSNEKDVGESAANHPYDLLMKNIRENNLPLSETFYGRYTKVYNNYFVEKGEAGKSDKENDKDQNGDPDWPRFILPLERFKDKVAALEFVESSSDEVDTGNWSETAIANYGTTAALEAVAQEINDCFDAAGKGNAYADDPKEYPLPKPPTPVKIKAYVAGIYDMEAADVDECVALVNPL